MKSFQEGHRLGKFSIDSSDPSIIALVCQHLETLAKQIGEGDTFSLRMELAFSRNCSESEKLTSKIFRVFFDDYASALDTNLAGLAIYLNITRATIYNIISRADARSVSEAVLAKIMEKIPTPELKSRAIQLFSLS
jgi:hypothetical protein